MKKTTQIILGISILSILISCGDAAQTSLNDNENPSQTDSGLAVLDSNKDGIVSPYEALDMLLLLQEENKQALTVAHIATTVADYSKEEQEEIQGFFSDYDKNKDGIIQFSEVDEDILDFVGLMDTDQNEEVTLEEMTNFDFTNAFLASEEDVKANVQEFFTLYEAEDVVDFTKITGENREYYGAWDLDHDGKITKKEATAFETANNTPAEFKVEGTTAFMSGVITSEFPATILELLHEHPEVTTIEMIIAPGSIDDVANLRASLYVHKSGLTTKLNANSYIASGGTDFFLAGKQRIVEEGATLGVHSWGGGATAATDLSKDDPQHQKYLDYYNTIGIPEAFYWYTLEAAPSNGMHAMTKEEIETYKVRKK